MGDDTVLALHFVSAAGEESGRAGNINTVEAVVLDKLAQMAQVARMCAQIFELQSTNACADVMHRSAQPRRTQRQGRPVPA